MQLHNCTFAQSTGSLVKRQLLKLMSKRTEIITNKMERKSGRTCENYNVSFNILTNY